MYNKKYGKNIEGFFYHEKICPIKDLGHKKISSSPYINDFEFKGCKELLIFSQNKEVNIFISKKDLEEGLENGYKIIGDNYYIDILDYLDFITIIAGKSDGNKAKAYFQRTANISDIGEKEKEKIILNSREETILEWIRGLDKKNIESFFKKIETISEEENIGKLTPSSSTSEAFLNLISKIDELSIEYLDKITGEINRCRIQKVLDEWESNRSNEKETEFWQPFFKKNSWILSQLFGYYSILYNDEFYVGGQYQGNQKGRKNTDFAYINHMGLAQLTGYLILINCHYGEQKPV